MWRTRTSKAGQRKLRGIYRHCDQCHDANPKRQASCLCSIDDMCWMSTRITQWTSHYPRSAEHFPAPHLSLPSFYTSPLWRSLTSPYWQDTKGCCLKSAGLFGPTSSAACLHSFVDLVEGTQIVRWDLISEWLASCRVKVSPVLQPCHVLYLAPKADSQEGNSYEGNQSNKWSCTGYLFYF